MITIIGLYRNNPAYKEVRISSRDALLKLFQGASKFIVSVTQRGIGVIGSVFCDTFSSDEIPGYSTLSFSQKGSYATKIVFQGDLEYADCFYDNSVITIFLKLSTSEIEHQIVVVQ